MRFRFIVTIEAPEDLHRYTNAFLWDYVETAIENWRGGMDPENPIFGLPSDAFKVSDAPYLMLTAHIPGVPETDDTLRRILRFYTKVKFTTKEDAGNGREWRFTFPVGAIQVPKSACHITDRNDVYIHNNYLEPAIEELQNLANREREENHVQR